MQIELEALRARDIFREVPELALFLPRNLFQDEQVEIGTTVNPPLEQRPEREDRVRWAANPKRRAIRCPPCCPARESLRDRASQNIRRVR